jgi:hypothetical protein
MWEDLDADGKVVLESKVKTSDDRRTMLVMCDC